MDETQEADFGRRLYQSCCQLRDWTLSASPGWRFPRGAAQEVKLLNADLEHINASVVSTSDPYVWLAPSPWHAAIYCQMLQHHRSIGGSRFLFRGQRNCSWPLVSSLARDHTQIDRESFRALIFQRLLARMSFNTMVSFHPHSETNLYLRMGEHSYVAAAQHYGIKTFLLDFTTDADVAVKFATDGESKDGEMGSVYLVPIELLEQEGLEIILPPPFINRLYIQRGLFVLAAHALDKRALGIMEIRFPVSPLVVGGCPVEFEVLREGGKPLDLLPPEQGLEKVVRAVDDLIAEPITRSSDALFEGLASSLKYEIGNTARDPFATWLQFVDAFEDTLYALAYNFDDSDSLTLDLNRFENIVRGNTEVCCSVASMYRAIPRQYPNAFSQKKIAFTSRLADIIDEIAKKHGYDHKIEAEQYARNMIGINPTFT